MRVRRSAAAAAALAATGAYASNAAAMSAITSLSYSTVILSNCPDSASKKSLITVPQGMTVTYCPDCEGRGMSSMTQGSLGPSGSASQSQPGHSTIYTTTYESLCPTGVVTTIYTVTESCPEPTPTWTPDPDDVPQNYTVTVKECTV
ncbi:hypothetical protein K470DRAFT_272516 [Piedraia hortae CBS 480.64]|uniref:Uncharacterized protein n=1 Tax=Piedraia hortae CBS 480.64 TaxID=1314780 RepID=A0A6A7BT44_9PEZI|nr:hypothetical protein K470DRAFT_272516 [Piedraia hortae CBS 480.64]